MIPACPLPDLGELVVDIPRWEYEGWHGAPSGVCRLRVWESTSASHVAVVTELPDNPGMSVTNAAEHIFVKLAGVYSRGLVVMEHYHADPNSSSWKRGERLDRVWLTGHMANWQPVWPIAPDDGQYEAHALWAAMYWQTVTGRAPAIPPFIPGPA